jgi:hypothetical protein
MEPGTAAPITFRRPITPAYVEDVRAYMLLDQCEMFGRSLRHSADTESVYGMRMPPPSKEGEFRRMSYSLNRKQALYVLEFVREQNFDFKFTNMGFEVYVGSYRIQVQDEQSQ